MNVARPVAKVLSRHTTLTLECVDRMYLNVYVPLPQTGAGVAYFVEVPDVGSEARVVARPVVESGAELARCGSVRTPSGLRGPVQHDRATKLEAWNRHLLTRRDIERLFGNGIALARIIQEGSGFGREARASAC